MRPWRGSASAGLLGCLFVAALSAAAPGPAPEANPDPTAEVDPIGLALEKRIRGEAPLDDVRVEVVWARGGPMSSVSVYGNGVGIWDRKLQFRLTKPQVLAILKTLRQDHFGTMRNVFGKRKKMKGRVAVRAGTISKSVIQMIDGDQSPELAALADKLLSLCAQPAKSGVGAKNLAEGLQKVAAGGLAPETLSATVQRRFERPDPASGETGWILHLEGRVAVSESLPGGRPSAPRMQLVLSETDFRDLAGLLAGSRAAELPINLYGSEYTDLQLDVLSSSRSIAARRYLNMTPDTHGEAQKSFEKIYEAFRALNARARKDGKVERESD